MLAPVRSSTDVLQGRPGPADSACTPALVGCRTEVAGPEKRKAGRPPSDPLGEVRPGTPLRAPDAWPPRAKWPPSVRAAKAALDGQRNRKRSAMPLFAYASAIAQRGIKAGATDGADDLVEAFSIFNEIATSEHGEGTSGTWGKNNQRFTRYRALALFNASVCMQALPVRPAKAVVGDLLQRAVEAIGDAVVGRVNAFLVAADDALDGADREPLDWRGKTLVPTNSAGRRRVLVLSKAKSVTATWPGVRAFLGSFGLLAPSECRIQAAVVVVHPRPRSIVVGAA